MCSFFEVQMGNRFEHYDDSEQIQVVKGTVGKKWKRQILIWRHTTK